MNIIGFQLNFKIGDFEYNTNKIIQKILEYRQLNDMLVFSELCICGYPPHDLMYEKDFIKNQNNCIDKIIQMSNNSNCGIVIGYIERNTGYGKPFFNSLMLIENGKILYNYRKMLLPTYDIFDEYRHFESGKKPGIFKYKNEIIQFMICEDIWYNENVYEKNPLDNCERDTIICINASPSYIGKSNDRKNLLQKISSEKNCNILYVNQVGGYDDIVFDGGSFYISSVTNDVSSMVKQFEEGCISNDHRLTENISENHYRDYEFIYNQIVFGIKEYCEKCGFKKVVVGSSGGIDSALVLALAVKALGKENVEAITMPSIFSSQGSWKDSETLCSNLGIKLANMSISKIRDSIADQFNNTFDELFNGLADENTQARIRGTLLMARSNKIGSLVLSTGNKSELSVGYCTLYGDMNGGLAPISDLYKTEVFKLAKWINEKKGNVIPENIINKEPSAELAPDQKDSDSLPEYEILDEILMHIIEGNAVSDKINKELVKKIRWMVLKNEFKRRQAAPTIKIHKKSFGYGRRVPIAQSFKIL